MYIILQIKIYDSGNPDPNKLKNDCKVDDGKQCYSNGNEITFIFSSDWKEQTSTATIELFILATSIEHAKALVKAETKIVKKWEVWIIVGAILIFLTILGAVSFLILYCYRRKRAKEQIRTMQSCMIYASPTPVLQKYDAVW
uniref:Uncharacterized protein n=1 Tax=Panagrolaimus superbus TaxID=310955 RepID=A0A914YDY9_9BILA